MTRTHEQRWLSIAWRAIAAGERVALRQFDLTKNAAVGFKAHHEVVTKADTGANTAIQSILHKLTPDIPVLSEEGGTIQIKQALTTDLAWVLDPIDGTSNYSFRLPLWGISLGLIRDGEPILAAISLPALKQRYHATLGGGAWMGQARLHASQTKKLAEATGFLCYGYDKGSEKRGLQALNSLIPASRITRRLGAAVVEAAWVAAGHADYSVLHGIKPWDVAAGALIVREAGGDVVTPSGKPWRLGQPDIVYAAPGITRHIVNRLR